MSNQERDQETRNALKWWSTMFRPQREKLKLDFTAKFPDDGFGEAQIKILYLANKLQKLNVSKIELKDYRN